jgi:hypothetical protein
MVSTVVSGNERLCTVLLDVSTESMAARIRDCIAVGRRHYRRRIGAGEEKPSYRTFSADTIHRIQRWR